ncbi:MAG: histidine kinase [Propionibacteriaceae bacterium]|jgi:signal transduction histidine kinase|nr:histidine kinase [Propionibacteriaceae bacterium]
MGSEMYSGAPGRPRAEASAASTVPGVMKALLDIRLFSLVLWIALADKQAPVQDLFGLTASTAVALVIVPLVLIPLLRWETLGVRMYRSWWLPVVDLVIAFGLFALPPDMNGMGVIYIGFTLATLCFGGGRRYLIICLATTWGCAIYFFASGYIKFFEVSGAPNATPVGSFVMLTAGSIVGYYARKWVEAINSQVEQAYQQGLRLAQDEERLHLAQELHDTVSKTIQGCAMLAHTLDRQLKAEENPHWAQMELLSQTLTKARQEARELLSVMRSPALVDVAKAAPEWVEDFVYEHQHLKIEHRRCPSALPVSGKNAVELKRVVQELLENVHRHANTQRALVELAAEEGFGVFKVSDEGVGMGERGLNDFAASGHYGLLGVQERVARLGGEFRIEGKHPGTLAEVRFPTLEKGTL